MDNGIWDKGKNSEKTFHGLVAMKEERYKQAVEDFRAAAEGGHANAQYWLGMLYMTGKGTEKKETEGFQWLMEAAGQGHEGAKRAVGMCYCNGKGVAKDEPEGRKWYVESVGQSDILRYNYGKTGMGHS